MNITAERQGNTVKIKGAFTRPANTTAYLANQAVNNSTSAPAAISFTGVARLKGGSGYITTAKIQTDQGANVARFRLHLFTQATPTLPVDGAAYTLKWADRAIYVGCITFAAAATEGAGSDTAYAIANNIMLGYVADPADANLYGLLETLDGFTPGNAQNFDIELIAENN
jgi:hypothetical protein